MANGMAEIKGFGMVHWETMVANGNIVLIKVPACYVPTVKMRLLSPQDYSRYNEIEIKHTYSSNADFMQLQIATPDHLSGKQTSTVMVHANICMGACLPFLAGLCHIPPSPKEQFKPCKFTTRLQLALTSVQSICISQNIYDEHNLNLSEAQRSLKLDHDCFGHIGFQCLQHFVCPRMSIS